MPWRSVQDWLLAPRHRFDGLRNVPVAMQAVFDPMLLAKVVAMSRAPEKDAGTALFVDCARVSTRIAPKVHLRSPRTARGGWRRQPRSPKPAPSGHAPSYGSEHYYYVSTKTPVVVVVVVYQQHRRSIACAPLRRNKRRQRGRLDGVVQVGLKRLGQGVQLVGQSSIAQSALAVGQTVGHSVLTGAGPLIAARARRCDRAKAKALALACRLDATWMPLDAR